MAYPSDRGTNYNAATRSLVLSAANNMPTADLHQHFNNDPAYPVVASSSSPSLDLSGLLDSWIASERQNTQAANELQQKMLEQQIAATQQENSKDRGFQTAERIAAQDYSTRERIAAQEYNTGERLAVQQYNSAEAQKTRDWETDMSNTAYQRAVSDMMAAGLNPALAFSQGGASTPTAASATSAAAHSAGAQSRGSSGAGRSFNSASAYKAEVSSMVGSALGYLGSMASTGVSDESSKRNLAGNLIGAFAKVAAIIAMA